MIPYNHSMFAIMFVSFASMPGFSQESDSGRRKTEKNTQPEIVKRVSTKTDGLRKISSSHDLDFDININEVVLEANIESAVEDAIKSVELALEKMEINIEPIKIDLCELNLDVEPVEINIDNIDVEVEPIEITIPESNLDIEVIDILDNDHFDTDNYAGSEKNSENSNIKQNESTLSVYQDREKDKDKQKNKSDKKAKAEKMHKQDKEKSKGLKKIK